VSVIPNSYVGEVPPGVSGCNVPDYGGSVTQFGLAFADTARQLGVSTAGIAKSVARAEQP